MAKENSKGVFIEGHNDPHGTSHINFYDRDPSKKGHESIHINIKADSSGTIVEKDSSGNKTITFINLNK